MLVRSQTKIVQHLDSFCILNLNVIFLDHRFHEVLMNKLPKRSPELTILHYEQMVTTCHKIMRNVGMRPVAVLRTLLVDELLDDSSISNNYGCPSAELEGI